MGRRMNWRKVLIATCIPAFFTLAGCAIPTPYQQMAEDGGYNERRLSDSEYVVIFRGNGFTNYATARDYATYRAAEIGKKLGYRYAVPLGMDDHSRVSTANMPITTTTNGTYSGGTYQGNSVSYGGTVDIFKPGIDLRVTYFSDTPTGKYLEIWDIDQKLAELQAKYPDIGKPPPRRHGE